MPKCEHDPKTMAGQPVGMYHCPECGEMVVAGMDHPDYDDVDLGGMTEEQLRQECLKLRRGIRAHRDATGHNLCWYVPELWDLLPDKIVPAPAVPPRAEFLEHCARYRDSLPEGECARPL